MLINQAEGAKFQSGKTLEEFFPSYQVLTVAVRDNSIHGTIFAQQNALDEKPVIMESLSKVPNVTKMSDKIK